MIPYTEPSAERAQWALEAMEAFANDDPEPEPPESIKQEREERERRRKARRASRLAVAFGYVDPVPPDEQCVGVGRTCIHCGEELPSAGDPPQRCSGYGGLS